MYFLGCVAYVAIYLKSYLNSSWPLVSRSHIIFNNLTDPIEATSLSKTQLFSLSHTCDEKLLKITFWKKAVWRGKSMKIWKIKGISIIYIYNHNRICLSKNQTCFGPPSTYMMDQNTPNFAGNRYLLSPVKATNIKKLGIDPIMKMCVLFIYFCVFVRILTYLLLVQNTTFSLGSFLAKTIFFGRIKDNGDQH